VDLPTVLQKMRLYYRQDGTIALLAPLPS